MSAVSAALPRSVSRVSPRAALAAIVLAGTALQAVLARLIVTPSVFPDEYLYSQLSRSIATGGQLRIRGVNPHFLPVLEPILTAPVWFAGSVETSFHLLQLENAFVMSLAALPAYHLARRLSIGVGMSLAVAALTVSGPPGMFTGMFLSEPFAYPLALLVVAAAVAAIDRPSLRAQLLLLAASGLAAFDRLQLAALPLCAAAAVVLVGARERRLRAAVRENWLLLGTIAGGGLLGMVVVLVHGLGFYHLAPRTAGLANAAHLGGMSLYVVVLATGVAVVPAALVGLVLAVVKPRNRAELAFAAVFVTTASALIVQCLIWGDLHRVQERYLGYLLPLVALAFALRTTRTTRRFTPELGVAASIAAVAAAVPLNGYAEDSSHYVAPTFYAFERLQYALHSPSGAAAAFALAATALALLGVLRAELAIGAALLGSVALLVGATSWSGILTSQARGKYLPPDPSWIDSAVNGSGTMLIVGQASMGQSVTTLFWNPSLTRVVRMPGARNVDHLRDPEVRVDPSGTVRFEGAPLRGAVALAATPASAVALRGAQRVEEHGTISLWQPRNAAQLAFVINNRLADGRVLKSGGVRVWSGKAQLAGWVELRVTAPRSMESASLRVGAASVTAPAGTTRTLRVAACGKGPWAGTFQAAPVTLTVETWTSPLVSVPRYVADPRACR